MFIRHKHQRSRRGSVALETAVVLSALSAFLFAGAGAGLVVASKQELSRLAQESSRWASLQEPFDRTPAKIMTNVVRNRAVLLDKDHITVTMLPAAANTTAVKLTYPWSFQTPYHAQGIILTSKAATRGTD